LKKDQRTSGTHNKELWKNTKISKRYLIDEEEDHMEGGVKRTIEVHNKETPKNTKNTQ
jgi:hypothetical protein